MRYQQTPKLSIIDYRLTEIVVCSRFVAPSTTTGDKLLPDEAPTLSLGWRLTGEKEGSER